MLTKIDIKRMPSYTLGDEDGLEQTRAAAKAEVWIEGWLEGWLEGRADVYRKVVPRLLRRFSLAEVAELLDLLPEDVERIADAGPPAPDALTSVDAGRDPSRLQSARPRHP